MHSDLIYEGKCWPKLLYSVSIPLDRSYRFTLHHWQACSFRHQLTLSGKHFNHAQITREDNALIFQKPSIARYSFIHLSYLGRCGENEIVHCSNWDPNPGYLYGESDILQLSHRAPLFTYSRDGCVVLLR